MNLFELVTFTSHSSLKLHWKIECDALSTEDIETFAVIIRNNFSPFSGAYGVPDGGTRIANAVRKYATDQGPFLIIDDVLTTGNSMIEAKSQFQDKKNGCLGIVLFARNKPPDWITPIFQLTEGIK